MPSTLGAVRLHTAGFSVGRSAALWLAALVILLSSARSLASDCLPIGEARQHVGETKCITGKVSRVKVGAKGVHFVDFCEDEMACPFTVVVFPSDLKDVGDVRRLAGHVIEIHGAVKLYDGRAEIILNRVSQLTGGTTLIPALPKNYDVEKQGHYSAGRLRPTKKPKKTKATPATATTYGNEVDASGEPPQ
ncbi:MAG: nucleic acid binding, OB-fold, tRNA/helicase-type [Candidatus Sulfotelmatobacter sp.]|nr:nucleic acid binding, OB-fold, tRNA/helicase-type [Candidatus Sulfotelmatobacter sp.]